MWNKNFILFYYTQIVMNVLSSFLAPSFEEIKLVCNGYSLFLPLLTHEFTVQLFFPTSHLFHEHMKKQYNPWTTSLSKDWLGKTRTCNFVGETETSFLNNFLNQVVLGTRGLEASTKLGREHPLSQILIFFHKMMKKRM
jgi:hypothetical protein